MADPTALTVAEGGTGSYGLTLTQAPTSDVTVTVLGAGGAVTAAPATLTFTADNWDTAQTVAVTGKQDGDGNDETVTLRHAASGGGYAVAGGDARSARVEVTVEDDEATAPGAPGLEAVAGNESVTLRWTPPNDDGGAPVTGYKYMQIGGDPAEEVGAEVRSGTVGGLANGTEYTFQVWAVNRVGEGAESEAKATPIPLTLTVEAVDAEVTEGEPVRYRIRMSRRTSGAVVESLYSHKGDFVRTPYSSVVSGIDSHLASDDGLSWVVSYDTVDDAVVEADGRFTVTIQRPDVIKDSNGEDFDQYSHGQGYAVGSPSTATVTILDNDGGAPPKAPPRPTVTVVSPTMLDATWGAAPENGAPVTGYIVEYRRGSLGPWTRWPEAIAPDARSVRLTGLAAGTDYEVQVQAQSVRGAGPWSAVRSAETATDPGVTVSVSVEKENLQTEGATLVFRVRANPAPASALRVDLRVTETLEMLSGQPPTSVTVPAGQRSATFEVRTRNDGEDEGYSEVTAELRPSVRYRLGTARAMYRVHDNERDTERGAVQNPRVEVILDPAWTPEEQALFEKPIRRLRFTWDPPTDVALAHVRGWGIQWEDVESCSDSDDDTNDDPDEWKGSAFQATEDTVYSFRASGAMYFTVRALLLGGAPPGPWSEPKCGDVAEKSAEESASGPRASTASGTPEPALSVADASAVEGGTLAFAVTLDRAAPGAVSVDWATSDGTAEAGSDYRAGSGTLRFSPGQTSKTVRVESLADTEAEGAETMRLTLSNASGSGLADGKATGTVSDPAPPEPVEPKPEPDGPPPAVSIADARVEEGPGAVLAFAVTLDRASQAMATVDWETRDGSARAGDDYVAGSGTLRFSPGQTAKTIRVSVLDDSHDEGREVMLAVLSNPVGATIAKAAAGGMIDNTDPMPQAWLGRFGRTASDHAIEAIGMRFDEEPGARPESHLTVGGRRLDNEWRRLRTVLERERSGSDAGPDAPPPLGAPPVDPRLRDELPWERMDRLKAEALGPAGGIALRSSPAGGSPAEGSPAGGGPAHDSLSGGDIALRSSPAGGGLAGGGLAGGSRAGSGATVGGEAAKGRLRGLLTELLGLSDIERLAALSDIEAEPLNTSFFYSGAPHGTGGARGPEWLGQWSAWGRSAATRFSGAEGKLAVDGDVTTATVGFDTRRERLMAGVALAYSEGRGTFAQPGASGGAIASTLASLHPFAQYRFNERTSVWGVLGHGTGALTLTPQGAASGVETDLSTSMAAFGGRGVLSVRSAGEAQLQFALRTDGRFTSTVSDAVENLGGARGATSRVRLVLEGRGSLPLLGGVLSPTLEAGLRHDGGEAETGAGLEIGGGLGYASGRFSVQVNARGLLAHRDEAYEEWGVSGSVRFTPRKDGRGLSVDLGSTWGAAQSGVQSLWSAGHASGLAPAAQFQAAQRFQAQLGYGFDGRKGRARWQPYLKAEAGENGSHALRFGLKMTSGKHIEAGLEIAMGASGPGRVRAGGLERGPHAADGAAADTSSEAIRLQGSLRW